jgi:type I restriction enzyme S subunit
MKAQSKNSPRQWRKVRIEEIFAPLEDGRTMHQGWSPQCEKQPSRSEKVWGVLRTTSIQPGEFQPEHNKLLPSKLEPRPLLEVKPGDILITCAGPRIRCGISCLVENTRGRLMISGKMYRFRTRPDEVLPKYLVAFLQSEDAATAIDGMKTGGSESGLNLTHERFRQLLVPIGPLAEQQRIVGLLDEAFEGIATAKANAEKNLQNARALFESHLQSVFTQRGPGWVEKPFEELIESNVIGLTKNSREQGEDKAWPYVKMNNITRDNRFDFTSFTCVDATAEEVSKFSLKDGDFLFNTRNSHELVGKSCIYESDSNDAVLYNNNIMRVRFQRGIDARFVLLAFSSKGVAEELNALKSGTTNVSAIYFKDLKSLVIPVPPIAEQRRIAAKLDALSEETQRLARLYERKHAALEALKKSLLHQAFTGQL